MVNIRCLAKSGLHARENVPACKREASAHHTVPLRNKANYHTTSEFYFGLEEDENIFRMTRKILGDNLGCSGCDAPLHLPLQRPSA